MQRSVLVLAALAGCWEAPRTHPITSEPYPSRAGTPGLVWASPVRPYRLSHPTNAIAIAGNVALVGGDEGWLTKVDLKTGATLAERQLDARYAIKTVAALPDKHWFAIGQGGPGQRMWSIDDVLNGTVVEVPNADATGYGLPELAVTADGGLVIAAGQLPLAIYDPKTFALRDTLDPDLGWSHVRVLGDRLLAEHRYSGWLFDLTAKTKLDSVPLHSELTTRSASTVLYLGRDSGKDVVFEKIGPAIRQLPGEAATLATGPGDNFVTAVERQLQIRSASTGEVTRTIELVDPISGRIYIDGTRAVFEIASTLRVLDLATGQITSAGDGPWGRDNHVAIDDRGVVLSIGNNAAWQLVDGKILASMTFDGANHRTSHLSTASSIVLVKDKHVERRAFGIATPIATWDLADEAYDTWFSKKGDAVVFDVLSNDGPMTKAVVVRDGVESDFIRFNPDGALWDVDVDTGEALVILGGTIALAIHNQPVKTRMHIPSCDDNNEAHLEHGTKRVLAVAHNELALFDRSNGALLSAARFVELDDEAFIPGRSEILVAVDAGLGVWSMNGDFRISKMPNIRRVGVSPDGRRAVAGFTDGHVAVFDIAQLLAQPLAPAPGKSIVPNECGPVDPFDVPEVEHDECYDCD